MDSESLDLKILLLPSKDRDRCVIFSLDGNFLFEKDLLRDPLLRPERKYAAFYSPFPYSYLVEQLSFCTSIALKASSRAISKIPISVIACGGEAGYSELGEFRAY